MSGRRAGALALLLATSPGVAAQTLDEILASYLEARGGAQRLAAVQSLRLTGQIQFAAGPSGPFTLERRRPKSMRAEFLLEGARGVQAFDGRMAWTLAPGEKAAETLSGREAGEVEEQSDIDGPLVDWKAKGHSLALLGRQMFEGRDTWMLRLTSAKGNLRTVFLDARTFLEACIEGPRTLGGEELTIESWLSDYRTVDGIPIPFRIESGPKGMKERQRIAYDKAELNVSLDAARFRLPATR